MVEIFAIIRFDNPSKKGSARLHGKDNAIVLDMDIFYREDMTYFDKLYKLIESGVSSDEFLTLLGNTYQEAVEKFIKAHPRIREKNKKSLWGKGPLRQRAVVKFYEELKTNTIKQVTIHIQAERKESIT